MGWFWFICVQLMAFALMIIGWVLLIPFAWMRWWVTLPGGQITAWRGGKLMYLWGNDEEGVMGPVWYRAKFRDDRLAAYCWSAWRNSANNLRFLVAWKEGPFRRWTFRNGTYYVQIGFRPDSGWPVMSGGKVNAKFPY